MSFWNYRGRCIGRVIHFLYHYAGMDVAEHATIDGDRVEYRGKPFATYKWSDTIGLCDVPEFTFVNDPEGRLAEAMAAKAADALADGCAQLVPEHHRMPVSDSVLYVLNRDAHQGGCLYLSLVHDAEPSFFVRDGRLYASVGDWIYAWIPEAKNWTVWVMGERASSMRQAEEVACPA